MSLQQELLKDLDSDSEFESDEGIPLESAQNGGKSTSDTEMGEDEHKVNSHSEPLDRIDLTEVRDLTHHSSVLQKLPSVLSQIEVYMGKLVSKSEEKPFLLSVNDFVIEISNEISIIHNYLKIHYGKRFPELESLIPNPIEYSKSIQILGNNLYANQDTLSFLSKDKILVVAMSSSHAQNKTKPLSDTELNSILKACELLLNLDAARTRVNQYVSSRLAVFAPNLSAIIGTSIAAKFMNTVGGIEGLAITQPRNIPSIGNNRTAGVSFGNRGASNQGYLYESDIIQNVPSNLRTQAMRKVSAKMGLAARMDVHGGAPDGSYGERVRKELIEALVKLEEPPEIQAVKALPIPKDRPAKKRAGRKLRKLKERFETSELRKLQNRVEFGKQEDTVMDAYGEEVGLGMTGSMRGYVKLNNNTRAKMSKAMKSRLESSKPTEDLFNTDLLNLSNKSK